MHKTNKNYSPYNNISIYQQTKVGYKVMYCKNAKKKNNNNLPFSKLLLFYIVLFSEGILYYFNQFHSILLTCVQHPLQI